MPQHVAEDERSRLEPRDPAQRVEVRGEPEVAVATLPAGDLVPGNGVHLHLEREQVVAALDRVPGLELLQEELAVDPLAHQAALHVGERDDDRVDRAALDLAPQLVQGEHVRILYEIPRDLTPAHAGRVNSPFNLGGRMSSGPSATDQGLLDDREQLHKLGYAQELFRSMGGFQNFAISFTIISILAGCLTSYAIAFNQGGPVAITWGWLLVGVLLHHRLARDGRDRLDLPDRRRPVLLVIEARQPGLGLVHRLVQPARPDRRHRGDRLRLRDLHDQLAQLDHERELRQHLPLDLPDLCGDHARGRRGQHVQGARSRPC